VGVLEVGVGADGEDLLHAARHEATTNAVNRRVIIGNLSVRLV